MSGVPTTKLPRASGVIDELIVNAAGNTCRVEMARAAAAMDAYIGPSYQTRAELNGDLAWPDGSVALVYGDNDPALIGSYRKFGASGTGGWSRIGDLPASSIGDDKIASEATARAAAVAELEGRIEEIAAALNTRASQVVVEQIEKSVAAVQASREDENVSPHSVRPGDQPQHFTFDLSVVGGAGDLFSEDGVTLYSSSDAGNLARVATTGSIAPRAVQAVYSGQSYRARARVRRLSDTNDPSNDAVQLGVQCFDGQMREIGRIILRSTPPRVANGEIEIAGTFGLLHPLVHPETLIPAATVYVRAFVTSYHSGGSTGIAEIDVVNVTDIASINGAMDVAQINAALTRAESAAEGLNNAVQQAADAAATVSSTLSEVRPFTTRADFEAESIPAPVETVVIDGLRFIRGGNTPAITSADGATWSPKGRPHVDHFGGDLRAALEAGVSHLTLGENETYYLDDYVYSQNLIDLNMNGSTLVCPNGGFKIWNRIGTYSGLNIPVSVGKYQFSLPAGVSVNVGDVVLLESDDIFCPVPAENPYHWGQYSTVESIEGGICTLNKPIIGDYTIHRIKVYAGLDTHIYNGRVDLTGSPEKDPSDFPSIGMYIIGRDVRISNMLGEGSRFAGKCFILEGVTPTAYHVRGGGFLNKTGWGTGASRWGYLIDIAGYDALADQCSGHNCKHVIASGARNFVTDVLTYRDCSGRTPKGDHTRYIIKQDGVQEPRFLMPLEAHGGVKTFNVIRPVIQGVNSLISTRAKITNIVDADLTSYGTNVALMYRALILHAEQVAERVSIIRPKIRWDPGVSAGGSRADEKEVYLLGFWTGSSGHHGDIEIVSPRGNGYRMMYARHNPDMHFKSISVTDAVGTLNGGLWLGGEGSAAIGSIGRIEMVGDTSIDAFGQLDTKMLVDVQCASLDSLRVGGRHRVLDPNAPGFSVRVGNINDSMLMPFDADFSGFDVESPVAAIACFTADTTRQVRRWKFDGANIKYQTAGLAMAGQGVNLILGRKPLYPMTFAGTTFDDSGTTEANSEDIRVLANNSVDLSGARLTKHPAIGGEDIIPVGCTVAGSEYVEVRRSQESTPYRVRVDGTLVWPTTPPYWRLPTGTIVWNDSVGPYDPPGWMRTTDGWRPLALLQAAQVQ